MHLLSGRSFYKGPDVLSTAGQELFRVLRMELLKDCYHSHYKWRAVDLIGWTSCHHSTCSKKTGHKLDSLDQSDETTNVK